MSTVVYYPRIRSINFYDAFGNLCSGMRGSVAREKFFRLVLTGRIPRISMRTRVSSSLKGGSR